MTKLFRFLLALWLLTAATPAAAGPLVALIPVVVGALVSSAVAQIAITVALTVAVSALQAATRKKPLPPGIQTERKLYGGTVSRTILLGLYATAGSEVTPPMSFGKVGKTPNAYLNVVVDLADIAVDGLSRIMVGGEYVPVNMGAMTEHGYAIGGKYAGRGWIKFYDGRQTTADPTLVAHYGSYLRPWNNSKIGKGVSYAILTWLFDAELFRAEPEVKFEVRGMRLYDPRKDSTIGGSGSHRFNDPSTYTFTVNPMVMIYNILRGITFADGSKYGGECTAMDLPLANWSAAMNVCDENVNTSGGVEPRYRAGFEINVAEVEPADAIEELLKACSGDITEAGGVYKTRCGPPALPVMFITDGDFLVNEAQDFDPFPGIATGKNTVYATYPSPEENWASHDAPVQTDQAYIDRDQGMELPASLSLPAVPYPLQVQRLMKAWLKDDQRWRQHSAAFGHYGFILEPLDTISWTSEHNQYDNKLFEVDSCSENLTTLRNTVALREVDPDDYNYVVTDELPDPVTPGNWELPASQAVPGFGAVAATVKDASGKDRRPAIRVFWAADAADDAQFIQLQVKLAASTDTVIDVTAAIRDGERLIVEGLLPATEYQARGKFVADRATEWTSWIDVATPDVRLSNEDIAADFDVDLSEALERIEQAEKDIAAVKLVGEQLQDKADQAAQDILSLGGEVQSVTETVATYGASITNNATAITNVAGDLASLTQTVSTQGASISQNATAISTLTTTTAQLSFAVRADNSNLLRASNFETGIGTDWIAGIPGWSVLDAADGRQLRSTAGIAQLVQVRSAADVFGSTLTMSADMYNAGSGSLRIEIYSTYADNTSVRLGGVSWATGDWSTNVEQARRFFSVVVPNNAINLFIYISVSDNNALVAVRKLKLEYGSVPTRYSSEASVLQQYQAISTLDAQYASLSSTVSTQGVTVSQSATAISTLNTQYGELSSTVSTQGGSITQNANAISNLSGTVSSLSQTVSAQGASVSANSTAISTLSGNVNSLFARYALTLDVNGYITGFEANNNGQFGDFVIRADRFRIVAPGGGARTEYSNGNWRVYDENGTLRVRLGVWQ